MIREVTKAKATRLMVVIGARIAVRSRRRAVFEATLEVGLIVRMQRAEKTGLGVEDPCRRLRQAAAYPREAAGWARR